VSQEVIRWKSMFARHAGTYMTGKGRSGRRHSSGHGVWRYTWWLGMSYMWCWKGYVWKE